MARTNTTAWVKNISVPIYPVYFALSVAPGAAAAVKAHKRFTNAAESELTGSAFALYKGCDFGAFFSREWLSHSVIGHELMHVTHRMMEYCSIPLETRCSEPYAFLNGWLHRFVYAELHRRKEIITHD